MALEELKTKRKSLRGRCTRTINRLKEAINNDTVTLLRLENELDALGKDFREACDINTSMISLVDETSTDAGNFIHWEADLIDSYYNFLDEASEHRKKKEKPKTAPTLTSAPVAGTSTGTVTSFGAAAVTSSSPATSTSVPTLGLPVSAAMPRGAGSTLTPATLPTSSVPISLAHHPLIMSSTVSSMPSPVFATSVDPVPAFDSWIDELVEFRETVLPSSSVDLTVAAALYRIEAGRDIPTLKLKSFSGLQRLQYFADVNAVTTLRLVVQRLPDYLIDRWQDAVARIRERDPTRAPTILDLSEFLRKKVRAKCDPDFGDLRSTETKGNYGSNSGNSGSGKHDRRSFAAQAVRDKVLECYICSEPHKVPECPTFVSNSISERQNLAKTHNLCYSCLIKGHRSQDCRGKRKCGKGGCTRWHHVLLHVDSPPPGPRPDPPATDSSRPTVGVAKAALDKGGILPVVRVLFRSENGRVKEGNVLLDSGSTTNIVRSDFAKGLGLQGRIEPVEVLVVGGSPHSQQNSRRLKFWLSHLDGGEEHLVEAHEMDCTVSGVPPLNEDYLCSFSHLSDLDLSHPGGPIDLILGVQYSHLHSEEEVRRGLDFEPVAKRVLLGWYVIGAKGKAPKRVSVNLVRKLAPSMSDLYDLEVLGVRAPSCSCPIEPMSSEDRKALELLESSVSHDGDRYMIGLPWRRDPCLLPDNYSLAEKRLYSLEKSLSRDSDKASLYNHAVQEYLDKGWAVKAGPRETDKRPLYYLPHHGVYRPDKPSTPLRIVFDPASRFQGVSLNSFLYKGPNLIGNLLGVLLRFREDLIAIVGDISKMFLQIRLKPEDTEVHRFLWRNLDDTREPEIYKLTRVAFGDKSSPDMASLVMLKIAERHETSHPDAAQILKRDRYMDDLIHSCEQTSQAKGGMGDLDEILDTGKFGIKIWYSNLAGRESMSQKSEACVGESVDLGGGGDSVKTLGVSWNHKSDMIHFRVKDPPSESLTKRLVLSYMSTLFDPLGLATPVTVTAKIAMQDNWRIKELGWDTNLPPDQVKRWSKIFADFKRLETSVVIPRSVKPVDALGQPQLHVFVDASLHAYGACGYMLWPMPDGISVRLYSSKARVAPLHQTTVPRLELMAALIGSRLAKTIHTELRTKPDVHLWSDSQIVLHWVKSESLSLKQFVGVCVAEILSTWDPSLWKYVPTALNPADDLTRGLRPDEMTGRWIEGPDFLKRGEMHWPDQTSLKLADVDSEKKPDREFPKMSSAVVKIVPPIKSYAYSSWPRLITVTALCLRFIGNLKAKVKKEDGKTGELEPGEREKAEKYWISTAQEELTDWHTRCKDLAPFRDSEGMLRVGGRLRKSPLSYDENHPFLLPSLNHISKLLMRDVHWKNGHCGCESTLCHSRRKYWFVKGRTMARLIVRDCVVCRKCRKSPLVPWMADLPLERLQLFAPVYSTTGLDLFGPFLLKCGRNKVTKAWGAIFTCATVRAIHLEIVENLSTQAFLHALRRFVSHHGWPSTIISDNGSSFVSTEKELKKLVEEGRKQFEGFAALHKVKWRFITPLSPNQGGFYESLIKLVKKGLKLVVGPQNLTWNEMSTVFAEVQNLVNSRPLGYSSNDPNDLQPLTPNHFLLERSKWLAKGRKVRPGDVVLLVDPSAVRGQWELGRIEETYPGDDGEVRNVKVKVKSGFRTRSVQRCVPVLEPDDDVSSAVEDVDSDHETGDGDRDDGSEAC
ncbi:uncharacterized protein LOC135494306 [Lineus longissimus]|uniref:uncharacterized protein LOC135494306 n=1 Tax=Lineus longissimus TaxID=88925 RepID=UPI00315C8DF5